MSAHQGASRAAHELSWWTLLLAALGPLWLELGRHILADPWAGYVGVVPLLLVWGAVLSRPEPARPRLAAALVGSALAIELVALVAGPLRAGRIALPLGVLGMSALLGRPARRFWPLALFLVPVPFAVVTLASPGLEGLWLRLAALLVGALGHPMSLAGPSAVSPAGALRLWPADGGLPLAGLVASLGCFAAARAGRAPAASLLRGLLLAPLAFPAQAAAVSIALLIVAAGHEAAARRWLDVGLPLVGVGLGLGLLAWGKAVQRLRSAGVPVRAVG
jgi:hypothetical protein